MEIEQAFSDLLNDFESETSLMRAADSDAESSDEEREGLGSTVRRPRINKTETNVKQPSADHNSNEVYISRIEKVSKITRQQATDNKCCRQYSVSGGTTEVKYIDENDNIEVGI